MMVCDFEAAAAKAESLRLPEKRSSKVAHIHANPTCKGLGFWARIGDTYFHSSFSRDDVLAKAIQYASFVMGLPHLVISE